MAPRATTKLGFTVVLCYWGVCCSEGGGDPHLMGLPWVCAAPPLSLPCLPRMVASYLVHHSYCATAEAFAKSTDQAVHEELASIKNRQSECPVSRTGCQSGPDALNPDASHKLNPTLDIIIILTLKFVCNIVFVMH